MFYKMTKAVLSPILHTYFNIQPENCDAIPDEGPVILACNHLSFLDSFFVPLVVPRQVTYVAKADYFDHWYTRIFFKSWGQIPIRREGGKASEAALAAALEVLDGGDIFAIYPEGTRSPDGRLHRGHTGVARLALRSGVPVLPVGVQGTYEVLPKQKRLPRRGRIDISFGRLLDFSRYAGHHEDKLTLRNVTDEIMYEIRELSGQDYVDVYASREPSIGPAQIATVRSAKEIGLEAETPAGLPADTPPPLDEEYGEATA